MRVWVKYPISFCRVHICHQRKGGRGGARGLLLYSAQSIKIKNRRKKKSLPISLRHTQKEKEKKRVEEKSVLIREIGIRKKKIQLWR